MAVAQLLDTLVGSADAAGNAEARELWYLQDVLPAAFDKRNPVTYGLPDYNTALASDPSLILDRYDVEPLGDGASSRIVGVYTTNKFGRLTVPQRPQTQGFLSWSWRPQSVEVTIPFGLKRTYEVNAADATNTFDAWDIETLTVTEQRQIFTLRVGSAFLTKDDAYNAVAACASQQNKIHTIKGRQYRYTTSYANQIGSEKEWEIVHEWEYDAGTPTPPSPRIADPSKISMPPFVSGSPSLIRLPFERLLAYSAANPKTTPPVFYGVWPFVFEPNGWQSLPGVPNPL